LILKKLERAIELRKEGKLEESNEILKNLTKIYPDNPTINYQCAWSFDVLGLEKEAVSYYEKAISIGLPDKDLQGAFLGLGSTYRTLGQYEKSKEVLEKGLSIYTEDRAMKIFYAMTLYNLNEHSKAMEILLTNLAQTSSDNNIKIYKKAIEFYSDKLDEVW
jgi:tetratricopeptide (TPR) repeat protein